jgi:hypothetical protein
VHLAIRDFGYSAHIRDSACLQAECTAFLLSELDARRTDLGEEFACASQDGFHDWYFVTPEALKGIQDVRVCRIFHEEPV